MARIRPVKHEDRLTLVEHLDELRTRLLISVLIFAVAWGLCFWQSDLVLDLLNRPLPDGTQPLTLSPTEPFFTTVTTSAYAALLLALPLVLYQLYAFVLPAFSPRERRAVFPLLMLVPLLFIGGVAFGYFVLLDRAVDFLLNFNQDQFNIQIRAREYYSFVALALVALGFLFQMPVVILGLTRLGVTTPKMLRQSRRYAILAISIVAMVASPGGDPMTMLVLMIPLLVLYELSIVVGCSIRPPARGAGDNATRTRGPRPRVERPGATPMLFDLKGKRKRLVQVVYVILAILFAGGLILFGIGGATSGGLLDALGGSGGGSSSSTFEKQVTKLERSVRAQPKNEKAWVQLARAEYQVATTGGDYDNQTGTFKEGALANLRRSARAWERYLALKPKKPDASVGAIMVQVYGTLLQSGGGVDAIGSLEQAARAQQIVAEARPSPIAYFNLASIQFLSGRIAAGDRSAKEAVDRTPKDQRNTVKAQIAEIRTRGLKIKRQTKKADEQAAKQAQETAKSGQDPFGTAPGGQVLPNQ